MHIPEDVERNKKMPKIRIMANNGCIENFKLMKLSARARFRELTFVITQAIENIF